jgi:hypothetical protein
VTPYIVGLTLRFVTFIWFYWMWPDGTIAATVLWLFFREAMRDYREHARKATNRRKAATICTKAREGDEE